MNLWFQNDYENWKSRLARETRMVASPSQSVHVQCSTDYLFARQHYYQAQHGALRPSASARLALWMMNLWWRSSWNFLFIQWGTPRLLFAALISYLLLVLPYLYCEDGVIVNRMLNSFKWCFAPACQFRIATTLMSSSAARTCRICHWFAHMYFPSMIDVQEK